MIEASQQSSDAILEATLALTAEVGWRRVSLAGIARRAGVDLVALHAQFAGKRALLAALEHWLDRRTLADGAPDETDPVRDRLFELIMRRLEAMTPHREAFCSIAGEVLSDPRLWRASGHHLDSTAALLLEAAGVSTWGIAGRMKVAGLCAVYLAVLRKWIYDESMNMGNTMVELDRALRRSERLALYLWPERGDGSIDKKGTTKV